MDPLAVRKSLDDEMQLVLLCDEQHEDLISCQTARWNTNDREAAKIVMRRVYAPEGGCGSRQEIDRKRVARVKIMIASPVTAKASRGG
jgi:hypothetical protein